MVQTMGNIHPGGEKGGFFNWRNTAMLVLVIKPDTAPTPSGIAKQIINNLFFVFKGSTSMVKVYANMTVLYGNERKESGLPASHSGRT